MLTSHFSKDKIEAGLDEAGRGCLAGPVVAAAVIFPKNFKNDLLNDSKQLSEKKRYELRSIVENEALAWAVAEVDNKEIDSVNILNASFLAMHRSIDQLTIKPELLLIDGNRFNKYDGIDHECIIKGDSKYLSIAGASILAKTYRDDMMKELSGRYPGYGWEKNAGYPTKQHRAAIKEIGVNEYHRKSFRLLPEQIEIF